MAVALNPKWKLPPELSKLSDGLPWPLAVPQWKLDYVEILSTGGRCLCSKDPIYQLCHIVNIQNHHTTIVGSCCIKKITENPEFEKIHNLFQAWKRVKKDPHNSANPPLIHYALRKHIFSLQDAQSYRKIWGGKDDASKQIKLNLNQRLLVQIKTHVQDRATEAELKAYETFEKKLKGPTIADLQTAFFNSTQSQSMADVFDNSSGDEPPRPTRAASLYRTPSKISRPHPYQRPERPVMGKSRHIDPTVPTLRTFEASSHTDSLVPVSTFLKSPIRVARALFNSPTETPHSSNFHQLQENPLRLATLASLEKAALLGHVNKEDREFYARILKLQSLGKPLPNVNRIQRITQQILGLPPQQLS